LSGPNEYRSGGARALVLLHERHLRSFLETWFRARAAGVTLPRTDDPSYASMETLLRHILRAARGYMTWMCEKLELPDPGIEPTPEADLIEARAREYMEHVLEKWRSPLAGVTDEQLEKEMYPSRWGTEYCIDAMLEHAVMHPLRHEFQLQKLMDA
jgi:uncharacterized damage-inducible protein DinB